MLRKIKKYFKYFLNLGIKRKDATSFRKIISENIIHYLTWRCNSRCITCNCWQTPLSEKEKEVWNIENIKKIYSTLKTNNVYLTGGEPTIVPEFKEIVYTIYKTSGAQILFNTNCLAIQKIKNDFSWLKEKRVDFSVSLSCNGFEKTHDFSRGIEGNYKKVMELMDFLKTKKIPFELLYTIFPFNIDETIEFVNYWRKQNIRIGLMIGRADDRYKLQESYRQKLFFSKFDYLKVEKILTNLIKQYPEYLPLYYLVKGINNNQKIFPCFGLVKRLVIDPYGNVYPCDGLVKNLFLGNLQEVDFNFKNFLEKNRERFKEVFEIIRDKKCQPCNYVCDLINGIYETLSFFDKFKILSWKAKEKIKNIF